VTVSLWSILSSPVVVVAVDGAVVAAVLVGIEQLLDFLSPHNLIL